MLDEILGAIAGGAQGVSDTWFGLQKLKQEELDRTSREKVAAQNNDFKVYLRQLANMGMVNKQMLANSGMFSTQELRNMGIEKVAGIQGETARDVAGIQGATAREVADTNADASDYRANKVYDASIFGSNTTRRGQDIGASTTRRGQDMTRGNVERGIAAGLWGTQANINQRNYAVGQANRRAYNKNEADTNIFGPAAGEDGEDANEPSYLSLFPDQPPALPPFNPGASLPTLAAPPAAPAPAATPAPAPGATPAAPPKASLENFQEAMTTLNAQIKRTPAGPNREHLKKALSLLLDQYRAAGGQ